MASAPMFPNFMSSTLGIKFNLLKSEKIVVKENCFLTKNIFLNLLCDNLNVSYREKRETHLPVSRRVRSAETLAVFPNFVRGLYFNKFVIAENYQSENINWKQNVI
jgi:hypothetical protein